MYNLQAIKLGYGAHPDDTQEKCTMEAVAFLAGEKHSDAPRCVCPVVAAYTRIVNDWFTQQERDQHLLPMLFDFVGTRVNRTQRRARARLAVNYGVKVFLLHVLSLRHNQDKANKLRALPDIVNQRTAQAAYDVFLSADSSIVVTTGNALFYSLNLDTVGDAEDAAETAALAVSELANVFKCSVDRLFLVAESINCIKAMLAIGDRTPVERVRTFDELACAMT